METYDRGHIVVKALDGVGAQRRMIADTYDPTGTAETITTACSLWDNGSTFLPSSGFASLFGVKRQEDSKIELDAYIATLYDILGGIIKNAWIESLTAEEKALFATQLHNNPWLSITIAPGVDVSEHDLLQSK